MAFLQSPGINITEIDISTVVPGVATSIAAIAGVYRWGPVNTRVLIDSESTKVKRLGSPTNFNAETWFTGASFLAYAAALEVVRAANTTGSSPIVTANVVLGNTSVSVGDTSELSDGMILISDVASLRAGATISVANATHILLSSASDSLAGANNIELQFINKESVFNAVVNTSPVSNLTINNVTSNENFAAKLEDASFDISVPYVAKWPGELGNSLKISRVDTTEAFESNTDISNGGAFNSSVKFSVNSNTAVITFAANTQADRLDLEAFNSFADSIVDSLSIGDYITAGNTLVGEQSIKITSVSPYTNIAPIANSAIPATMVTGDTNLVTTSNAFGEVVPGDYLALYSNNSTYSVIKVASVTGANAVILATAPTVSNAATVWAKISNVSTTVNVGLEDRFKRADDATSKFLSRRWEYADAFDSAPGQSAWVYANGNTAANDEIHAVVIDEDGKFTGVPGSILEKFTGLSRVRGSKKEDGTENYYKDVINSRSEYIWAVNDISGSVSANDAKNIASSVNDTPFSASFKLGADGQDESNIAIGTITKAYDQFDDKDVSDISFLLTGKTRGGSVGGQLANYLIDNIAEPRQDTVVFISPPRNTVVNNFGYEAASIIEFRNTLRSTSYAFLDSGYKYMYDKYNDVFRYIPLNGDMAGLAARTENTNDAWWSFAGLTRGKIKNVVRLAWNPRKTDRDAMYKNSINPVVTLPGDGTLLYGDKTLLAKPSAFDRINVRRLFIVLEKAIAKAARYTLFEFNDPFTRAQFRNLVIPFLRDIQGRRGINEFEVICDNSNNDGQTMDTNYFNADIYIKANRSINFIQLNFYNVPNGVAFSEVVRSQ